MVLQVLQQLRGRRGGVVPEVDAVGLPALPHDVRSVLGLARPRLPQRVGLCTASFIIAVVIIVEFPDGKLGHLQHHLRPEVTLGG